MSHPVESVGGVSRWSQSSDSLSRFPPGQIPGSADSRVGRFPPRQIPARRRRAACHQIPARRGPRCGQSRRSQGREGGESPLGIAAHRPNRGYAIAAHRPNPSCASLAVRRGRPLWSVAVVPCGPVRPSRPAGPELPGRAGTTRRGPSLWHHRLRSPSPRRGRGTRTLRRAQVHRDTLSCHRASSIASVHDVGPSGSGA